MMETQSAKRITCPHCGEQNYESDLVCWACNAPLHPSAQAPPEEAELAPLDEQVAEPLGDVLPGPMEPPLDGLSRFALGTVSLLIPGAGILAGIILLTVRQSTENRHFGIVCLALAIIPPLVWFLLSMRFFLPLIVQLTHQFTGPGNPFGGF